MMGRKRKFDWLLFWCVLSVFSQGYMVYALIDFLNKHTIVVAPK